MTQARSVSASFAILSYPLELAAGNGGTVSGAGNYEHGSAASISATPNTGYSFVEWTGDGVSDSTQASTSVDMTQARSVSASFAILSYPLELTAGNGGTVSGAGNYEHGSASAISATPNTGYSFLRWNGDGVSDSTQASTSVDMTQARSISASFAILSYPLELAAGNGGTVSGDGNYEHGSAASISATPNTGYFFVEWTGDGVSDSTQASTSVDMTQARSVSASFAILSYPLELAAGNGGTVSGAGNYEHGSAAAISATPNTGYSFLRWNGDGVSDSTQTSTSVDMTQARSVSASFAILSYPLELAAGNGGTVSGAGNYEHGSSASISATPNTGYSFLRWNGDGVSDSTQASTSVDMTQARSISASFAILSYPLELAAGNGGTVSGAGNYEHGSAAAISATPNTGYSFLRWNGDGVSDSTQASTSVDMTQARSISASFAILSYPLELAAGNGGTVSGAGNYEHGSSASISATPNTGYFFVEWTGDGVTDSTQASTSVDMTQVRSVSVSFAILSYPLELAAGNGGTVSGAGNYEHGSAAAISATPNTGYSFLRWNGDGVSDSTQASTSVDMTQARSISASFAILSYPLELAAGNGGTVSGAASYEHGSSASITATPNTGYSFLRWNGDGVDDPNSPTTSVSMNQARSISASFVLRQENFLLLLISSSPAEGGFSSGGGEYSIDANTSITATPNTGYSFDKWLGDGIDDPLSPSTSIIMSEDRNVSASFTINSYLLSTSAGTGGSVSPGGSFTYGSSQNLTATPNTGYSLDKWLGDGIDDPLSPSTSIIMSEDRNVSASFTINSYLLSTSAGTGGSVSTGGSFTYGSSQNLTATPNTGYSFDKWLGDGIDDPLSPSTSIIMSEDRNVSASFTINSYLLSTSAGTGGSVSTGGSFTYGSSQNLTATPNTGYSFDKWLGDGIDDPLSPSTSIIMSEDRNVSASFTINSYLLSTSAGTGGSVSTGGSFTYGSSQNLTATPNTGYSFDKWLGDGIDDPLSPSTSIIMSEDRNVSASFTINSYLLSTSAGTGGSVSTGGSFTYGSSQNLTATPNTGYSFDKWLGDGIDDPISPSTSIIMSEDRNVSASFTINSYLLSTSAGTGGSVSTGGSFTYGSSQNLTATPNTGYSFDKWLGDGIDDPISPSTSIIMSEDRNVSASFTINSYLLNTSAGTGGSVSTGGSFTYSSSQNLTATPNTGYPLINGWAMASMIRLVPPPPSSCRRIVMFPLPLTSIHIS